MYNEKYIYLKFNRKMEGGLLPNRYNISARCIFMVYFGETEASRYHSYKVASHMKQPASYSRIPNIRMYDNSPSVRSLLYDCFFWSKFFHFTFILHLRLFIFNIFYELFQYCKSEKNLNVHWPFTSDSNECF